MPDDTTRIAVALERIADTMEEQLEMAKIPYLDMAAILKKGADELADAEAGDDA